MEILFLEIENKISEFWDVRFVLLIVLVLNIQDQTFAFANKTICMLNFKTGRIFIRLVLLKVDEGEKWWNVVWGWGGIVAGGI